MVSARLLRTGVRAVTGLSGLTATYVGFKIYRDGTFDLYNVGAARFGRAAFTVASIGIDYRRTLYAAGVSEADPGYEEKRSACHQRAADKLLKLCTDNGGCFIKVGQHIGALDYLLPEEYVNTMKILHSRAPAMELKDVFAVIREDLGKEPDDFFVDFQEKPLGTASLAQVHKARLRVRPPHEDDELRSRSPPPKDTSVYKESQEDDDDDDEDEEDEEDEGDDTKGPWVAIKVQHRYVRNHSFVDIYTMDFLVRAVKWWFPQFEFMWLADEMKKNLPLELSFKNEGRNSEKIAALLDHFDWLEVPGIVWELTTDRVLTMEYCSGGHINDIEYIREHHLDPFSISKKISQMYADMIFRFGYVHCDPHPGNILVRRDSHGDAKIILLDHGLYTQLTHDFRLDYANFWLSILNANMSGIKQYADKLGVGQLYGLFACMVAGRSWASIIKGLDKAERSKDEHREIKDNARRYFREIIDVLAFVNRQMILIFKTNDLLRAIEHALGTSASMISFIQMSRACFRCLNHDRYRSCRNSWCRVYVTLVAQWHQFKITVYEWFLRLYWSRYARPIRSLL